MGRRPSRTNGRLARVQRWARSLGAREQWRNVDAALREGFRGLPGGSSLTQLLTEGRGKIWRDLATALLSRLRQDFTPNGIRHPHALGPRAVNTRVSHKTDSRISS